MAAKIRRNDQVQVLTGKDRGKRGAVRSMVTDTNRALVTGINMVKKHRANLKTLRAIWIDCGWRDQYHIQYGSRLLSARLAQAGIRHTYEEFDDDHSDIDYRMDLSLPFLYRALKP